MVIVWTVRYPWRGPVTNRELMYARLLGGADAAITRARLNKHDQPTDALDKAG